MFQVPVHPNVLEKPADEDIKHIFYTVHQLNVNSRKKL